MKKILIATLCVFSAVISSAADEYPIFTIPEKLLKNANAVLRLDETVFEISSPTRTKLKRHYVVTILNEAGDKYAEFSETYNKHRQLEDIEGALYDMMGKRLKKIKKKDTEDLSGVSDGTLIDDTRWRRHNFYHKIYPYTVEYSFEVEQNSSLFFPAWLPQEGEYLAVEKSSMNILCPQAYELRFKTFLYPGSPVAATVASSKTLAFNVTNIPAIYREAYSPQWHEMTTLVLFGPSDFQMDDYKGNMVNWQDFGRFVYSLKQGRDQLPDNIKATVHSLTDQLKDPKEKISTLYQYMQKNTRYISIQLGIGGWQPFEAKDVAAKGYGDCKALTNYMYSLLKEAGIPSYYTLVRAGRNSNYITSDFPSQQFNHVILSVPVQKDTVWLECTSQTMPAGYLGDFTNDREVLLIDENGGRMVRTPRYGLKDNLQIRNILAKLEDDGTLNVNVSTRYAGLQQDDVHELINGLSKDKVKEHLHEQLNFATYDINRFNYKEFRSQIPSINEELDITVSNYASITGKRIFVVPNVMTRGGRRLVADSARKYDIQLGYEYIDIDSVEIALPKGYTPEAMPPDVVINSRFGKYNCSVKLVDDKLLYLRKVEQFSGRYLQKDYLELVKYFEAIYKADRNKVVLVKN